MPYASNSHTAVNFGHTQERRVAQHMVLAAMWNAAMAAPAKLFGWWVEHRRVASTIATLQSLSDHTLADIGISRDQIGHVARHCRDTRF
jgi:uncharacterized protein YjiS (DUF1127 family)